MKEFFLVSYLLKFLQCALNTVTFLPLILKVDTYATFAGINLLIS